MHPFDWREALEDKPMVETVLWGTAKGAEDWQEDVITSTEDRTHLEKAIAWAKENGFRNLRLQALDGTVPNFAATITL